MYEQAPPPWQPPAEVAGPAPGVQFAPHGERLVAYIVDSIVLFLALMLAIIPIVIAGATNSSALAPLAAIMILVVVVLAIAYFPFFWARGGQTPGMKVFRLQVVRDRDGGPLSGGQAIMRLVGYWINGIVLYIGFAWVLVDARRRGWHDLIAGTVVIKR